jgi:hypothetical protein
MGVTRTIRWKIRKSRWQAFRSSPILSHLTGNPDTTARVTELLTEGNFEFCSITSGTRVVTKEMGDVSESKNLPHFISCPVSHKPIKAVMRHSALLLRMSQMDW